MLFPLTDASGNSCARARTGPRSASRCSYRAAIQGASFANWQTDPTSAASRPEPNIREENGYLYVDFPAATLPESHPTLADALMAREF